jgi:hypothetical protein
MPRRDLSSAIAMCYGAMGVMSRRDRPEEIFRDYVDRQSGGRGIKTLAETCQKTGFQVHT